MADSSYNIDSNRPALPSYDQVMTMEDEVNMQTTTADKAQLVPVHSKWPEETRGNPPPPYREGGYAQGAITPFSTVEWPAGGGYTGPLHGSNPVPVGQQRTVITVRRPVTIVGTGRRDNFVKSYYQARLGICCAILTVKVIVALVVVFVLMSGN